MANTEARAGDREYCSEQNAGESLWGTAAQVDVWICLEYRPVWKAKSMADNALADPTRDWLDETLAELAAVGLRGRPQFIRQPGSEIPETRLLVSHGGEAVRFQGQGYGFLDSLQLASLIGSDGGMAENGVRAGGERLETPVYLVCTNGQRDLCCARFGLPTYAALTEAVGDRAWQVTHLGGHRFAPNVLTLPDACLYGRVDAGAVPEFLARTEQGLDFDRLRGRTVHPPAVQAGEAALGKDGLELLGVDGADDRATIRFALGDEQLAVTVGQVNEPMTVVKSCGVAAEEVYPFRLLEP